MRAAATSTPGAEARLSVPIVLVPSGQASVTFLPASTSVDAVANLAVQVDVASSNLQSVSINLGIPLGPGPAPAVTVDVQGLLVPGSSSPIDLSLGGSQSLGADFVHALSALVEAQLAAATAGLSPDAAAVLAVIGLDPQAPIPLPIADIALGGLAPLQAWLGSVSRSPQGLQHWVNSVATLIGGKLA